MVMRHYFGSKSLRRGIPYRAIVKWSAGEGWFGGRVKGSCSCAVAKTGPLGPRDPSLGPSRASGTPIPGDRQVPLTGLGAGLGKQVNLKMSYHHVWALSCREGAWLGLQYLLGLFAVVTCQQSAARLVLNLGGRYVEFSRLSRRPLCQPGSDMPENARASRDSL